LCFGCLLIPSLKKAFAAIHHQELEFPPRPSQVDFTHDTGKKAATIHVHDGAMT
jgi:hypothetical protein